MIRFDREAILSSFEPEYRLAKHQPLHHIDDPIEDNRPRPRIDQPFPHDVQDRVSEDVIMKIVILEGLFPTPSLLVLSETKD